MPGVKGRACSPAAACVFTGSSVDTACIFTNTAVLQFSGDSAAAGTQISTYSVDGQLMCTWVTAVTLGQ